jgi:hypothetical protein
MKKVRKDFLNNLRINQYIIKCKICCSKKQLLSCFQAPLQDLRNWIRPVPLTSPSMSDKYSTASEDCDGTGGTCVRGDRRLSAISGYSAFLGHSSPFPSTRSEYSFHRAYSSEETEMQTSTSSPSPSPSLPIDLTGEIALGAVGGLAFPPYISYIDEVSNYTFNKKHLIIHESNVLITTVSYIHEHYNRPQVRKALIMSGI